MKRIASFVIMAILIGNVFVGMIGNKVRGDTGVDLEILDCSYDLFPGKVKFTVTIRNNGPYDIPPGGEFKVVFFVDGSLISSIKPYGGLNVGETMRVFAYYNDPSNGVHSFHISFRDQYGNIWEDNNNTNNDFYGSFNIGEYLSPPSNLVASLRNGYINLQWESPDSDMSVDGYKIYKGTASGGEVYLTTTTETFYRDYDVVVGNKYYYYVRAFNEIYGIDSEPSNEVSIIYEIDSPPTCSFSISPSYGSTDTNFIFTAICHDDSTPENELMVRWDFDGNGVWDTDWSENKVAYHKYNKAGNYIVRLETQDKEGKTSLSTRLLSITNSINKPDKRMGSISASILTEQKIFYTYYVKMNTPKWLKNIITDIGEKLYYPKQESISLSYKIDFEDKNGNKVIPLDENNKISYDVTFSVRGPANDANELMNKQWESIEASGIKINEYANICTCDVTSYFSSKENGYYEVKAVFEKEGYGNAIVTRIIQLKKLDLKYKLDLEPSQVNDFKYPSQIEPYLGEEDYSYVFAEKGKNVIAHLSISISPQISMENAKIIFGSSYFWKPVGEYTKDIRTCNDKIDYTIKVSDGMNYIYAIGSQGPANQDSKMFDDVMENYYIKMIFIPFDLVFKEPGANIWHKIVIPALPTYKPSEGSSELPRIVCPYSSKIDDSNRIEDITTGVYFDKLKDKLLDKEILPYSEYMGLVNDIWNDIESWYNFIKPRRDTIPDYLDFMSSLTNIYSPSLMREVVGDSGFSLYLLPATITSKALFLMTGKLAEIISYEYAYTQYLDEKEKKEKEATEKFYHITYNRYYSYQEIHLNDDEKNWPALTTQSVKVVNIGLKKMKVEINIYPLLEGGGKKDGSISWDEVIHKYKEILPGESVTAVIKRGSPILKGKYNRGFLIEVITNYSNMITYTTFNKYGLEIRNISSINFENNARKTKTLFKENEDIKMGIEATTNAPDRFDIHLPLKINCKIRRYGDGKLIEFNHKLEKVRKIKTNGGNEKIFSTSIDLGKLAPGKYYIEELQIYTDDNNEKIIFYEYHRDGWIGKSPWAFSVSPVNHQVNAYIEKTHSFNVTVCINGSVHNFTSNAIVYSPLGRVYPIVLNRMNNNCLTYHFVNDSTEGTYYIFINIKFKDNQTYTYLLKYIKTNDSGINIYNLSSKLVVLNSTFATIVHGKIKNNYSYDTTINLSINLPYGIYEKGYNSNRVIRLKPNESKYFDWILYSKNSYRGKIPIIAYNKSGILNISYINVDIYSVNDRLPAISLQNTYYYLHPPFWNRTIVLEVINPTLYKVNCSVITLDTPNLIDLTVLPKHFILAPYGKIKLNLSLGWNENISSYIFQLPIQFNLSCERPSLKKVLLYNLSVIPIPAPQKIFFTQSDIIIVNPDTRVIAINISNMDIIRADNLSIISDSLEIKDSPVNFSIMPNQTVKKHIILDLSNHSLDNHTYHRIYYLYLFSPYEILDTMKIEVYYLPDLRIKNFSIYANRAKESQYLVNISIRNAGKLNATNVPIELYDNDALINKSILPLIKQGESKNITFVEKFSKGPHYLKAVLNTSNTIFGWNNISKTSSKYFIITSPPYALTTSVSPSNAGYITLNPSGGIYEEGTVVTATAHAYSGYAFDHWRGDASGTNPTITITMDSNKSITAYFVEIMPPNNPPTIAITSPSNGSTVNGTITIHGAANDDKSVVKVEIRIDNGTWNIANGTTSWSYSINTEELKNGKHIIKARAYDGHNYSNVASIFVIVNNNANHAPTKPYNPYPANGSINVGINETLSWKCYDVDNDTITYDVYFGMNSNPPKVASNITSSTYIPALNYATTYYWRIVAWDEHGVKNVSQLWHFTTKHQNHPPVVEISSPSNGSKVSGVVIIKGNASDEDGDETLQKVEIRIDNGTWNIANGTTSWSYSINTEELKNGKHIIKARAYDGHNYSNVASISIEIKNKKRGIPGFELIAFVVAAAVALMRKRRR